MELEIFYVYVLLDTRRPGKFVYEKDDQKVEFDYEPYYIGKGGGNDDLRPLEHLKEAKWENSKDKNKHKINLIRYLVRESLDFKYEYLIKNLSEKEAYSFERLYIKIIGREDKHLGPLTNLTDGGEGISGYISKAKGKKFEEIYGEEKASLLKKKMSNSQKEYALTHDRSTLNRKWMNDGKVQSLIKEEDINFYLENSWKFGPLPFTKEHNENISKSLIGIKFSEERCRNISINKKGKTPKLDKTKERKKFKHKKKRTTENRLKLSIRNKSWDKIYCPHCEGNFDKLNYKRWHGDNCKKKPENENIKRTNNNKGRIFEKIECEFCYRKISISTISKHLKTCKGIKKEN